MNWLWGPLSPLGLGIATFTVLVDQANNLDALCLRRRRQGACRRDPFFDLILVWNQGISYGLLQQDSNLGRFALIPLPL